jgi:leucyl-tRNA synthetase
MATECKDYHFQEIERHWQSFWEEKRSFAAATPSQKRKYYVLDMFPYPSGAGLHMGHVLQYTPTDITARTRRAQGFNVLHPMGWDAFGLPAEQHAVKTGTHPSTNTQANISNFRRQLKALGFSYDWDREVDTTDPKYYRWTQWIFLQLFRRGLAYVDERSVWWCPELKTVLANEEVVDGRSEVGSFPVERRNLRQWVLRITAYAERLLADLKDVDWPDSTKRMQEAWIGRSEGAEIAFALEHPSAGPLRVFTTRPDTLFGCTYMVLAPEHPLVDVLTTPDRRPAVEAYRRQAAAKSDLERTDLAKDKSGVFSGAYALNPVNGERVPIWIADYVLMGYGTGAIMAVPAHDERDFEFAQRYGLPVVRVIAKAGAEDAPLPYTGEGRLVNSGACSGLDWSEAKRRVTEDLAARGAARATVNFKLRDWLFSRQRYWGEPIPVVWVSGADYERARALGAEGLPEVPVSFVPDRGAADTACPAEPSQRRKVRPPGGEALHALPLPAGALPLVLPEVSSYLPSGTGESPLANVRDWLEIWYDPRTGAAEPASGPRPAGDSWIRARRETNTMPQWAGSCWYYLRFTDPRDDKAFASPEALRYWGGPDLYVGGAEHAVLHLLYARFWHKVLFDVGAVPDPEPFRKLFHQGILLGEDGEKMSKSRGNVVNPDSVVESHGADTLRLYLMFLGPLESMKPWNPRGIEGPHRFLQKVWRCCIGEDGRVHPKISADAREPEDLTTLLHATIRKVGEDVDALSYNTAVAQMMTFANALHAAPAASLATVRAFVQVLAPFAPHLGEELWERLGGRSSVQDAPWPRFDPARLKVTTVKLVFQVNGKHRGDADAPAVLGEAEAVALAKAHPRVSPFLDGKAVKKVIYVPGRILNLVLEN